MRIIRSKPAAYLAAVYLLLLFFPGLSLAQSLDWEKTHGNGTGGYAVTKLDDGGFIAIGAGGEFPGTNGYVVRTDANGDKIWDKTIGGGTVPVWLSGVKKTADGGCVIVGDMTSAPTMWKLKSNGDIEWTTKLMGPASYGSASSVVSLSDGYVVTGQNFYAADYKMFVQKISTTGDSLWAQHLTTYKTSRGAGIRQTLDGGFLIVGQAKLTPGYRTYAVKVTTGGGIAWEKTYDGLDNSYDEGHDIAVHTDGYLIIGNKTRSTTSPEAQDADVIRIGLDGTQMWRKQITASGYNGANAVRQMTDGYMVVGYAGTSQTFKAHVWKLDLNGLTISEKEIPSADYLHYIDQAVPPLKFVVVGGTSTAKLYLARVDATTVVTPPDANTFIYTYDGEAAIALHSSNGWEGAGPGKIRTKPASYDTLTINGLMKIDVRSFTLDTTRSSATGKISFAGTGYLLSPLTRSIGKPTIAEGIWNGTIDDDGLHFEVPMRSVKDQGLFGSYMAIRNIDAGRYPVANVARLDGDFRMSGWKSCSGSEDIKFSNLEITQTSIDIKRVGDIQVEPGVCYQNLISSYTAAKDSLSLNGDFISYMFFRSGVKASTSIVRGNIKELVLEATKPEVPIGAESNYKVRDLTGKYSKWYLNFLGKEFPLGSGALINGTLTHPTGIFEVDLKSAFLSAPGELKGWGGPMNYRMFNIGTMWLLSGNGDINVKWAPGYTTFSVKGDVNVFDLGGGSFGFAGKGDLFANTIGGKPDFVNGKASGELNPSIFALAGAITQDPITASLGMAMQMGLLLEGHVNAELRLLNKKASLYVTNKGFTDYGIDVDLSKSPTDPEFMQLHSMSGSLSELGFFKNKTFIKRKRTEAATNTFVVAPNTRNLYVRVAGVNAPVMTNLITPDGTTITGPLADTSVRKIETSASEYWWFVAQPAPGSWSVVTPEGNDTVQVLATLDPAPLEITATQQGKDVTVTWQNITQDTVYVFLDKDQLGYDGVSIASAAPGAGTASFTLTNDLPECTYYVYAERTAGLTFQSDYAANAVENMKSILPAPANISVSYDATNKLALLQWDSTTDGATQGFIVRLFGNGMDTVIAMPFGTEKSTTFSVADPNGMFVTMLSYDSLGSQGCWSMSLPLGTSDVKPRYTVAQTLNANVLPNPTRDNASLRITLDEPIAIRITLVNAAGQLVRSIEQRTYPAGENSIDLMTSDLTSGSYIIVIEAGHAVETRRLVITR